MGRLAAVVFLVIACATASRAQQGPQTSQNQAIFSNINQTLTLNPSFSARTCTFSVSQVRNAQYTDPFVGNITFSESGDGSTFTTLATVTAPGNYVYPCGGYYTFKAQMTAYISGAATVLIVAAPTNATNVTSINVPYAASNCDGVLLQATCMPFGVDMTGTNDSTTIMQSIITYDCGLANPVPIVLGPGILKTGPVTIPCSGVEIDGTGSGGLLGGVGVPNPVAPPSTTWLWNSADAGSSGPLLTIGSLSNLYGIYSDKLRNISFQSASGVGAIGVRLLGEQFGHFEDLTFDQWTQSALEIKPYALSPTTGASNYGNYFSQLSWYNMSNSGQFVTMEIVLTPVTENDDFNEFHDVIANTSASGGLSLSCSGCDNNNFYDWHTVGAGATAGNIALTNQSQSNNFYGYSCAGVSVDASSSYNSFNEDDSANGCPPPTFAFGAVNNTAKVYGSSYNFHTGDTAYLALGNNFVAPPANAAGVYIGGNLNGNVAPQPSQIGTSAAVGPIFAIGNNRTGGSAETDFINMYSTTQSGDAFHFIYETSTSVDHTLVNITRTGGVCAGNGTTGYMGTGPCKFAGTGVPTFSAPNASEYDRYDGGTGARVYYNTSGASTSGTTWLPISSI